MKNSSAILIVICFFIAGCSNLSHHKNNVVYFIDSQRGDDNRSGISPKLAWKSLQRVAQLKLKPGDQIKLFGSSHFKGTLKLTNLENTKDLPLIISSYGNGKAIIESGDSSAVLASNCNYLKIRNIQASGSGRLKGNKTNGIELINCKFSEIDSVTANGFLYSGIRITGGNDICITHSYAFDNGFCGINVESGEKEYGKDGSAYKTMKHLYIGYCIAENNPGCPAIKNNHSGNGILIGGVTDGLIEYCEAMNNGWDMPREGNGPVGIWAYMSDSITIQHCFAHHNKTSARGKDGGGFDFDGGMRNSVMQYNLSAFNEGSGYGIFQYAGATEWDDNIVRFNISYNDGSKNGQCGIMVWCDPSAAPMRNFNAYNNTIVNNHGHGINFEPGIYEGFLFENNIIQVTSSIKKFIGGKFAMASFSRNLYWSDFNGAKGMPQPKVALDKNAIYSNPNLNLPSDSTLLENSLYTPGLRYFSLQTGSVCLKTGDKITNNGGFDFWKNSLSQEFNPNLGAWQGKNNN